MGIHDSRAGRVIAAMGTSLGPDILAKCHDLFDAEQRALRDAVVPTAVDCAYGPHDRHRLDLYSPLDFDGLRPVILFVHGGGFRMGDKGGSGQGDGGQWANAAVGRLAAREGCLGAVMNYRLVPDAAWPSGGEDVNAALDWLRANAAAHGGDPDRIVVIGTSAGSVHIATALKLRAALPVRGVALLSGLYGYTPLDDKDLPYYGPQSHYDARMPREAVAATKLPMFLACAEFDPPRFQAEFLGLMQERLDRHGAMPRSYIASGHNHYTMAMHLGTSDRRLADELFGFVEQVCG